MKKYYIYYHYTLKDSARAAKVLPAIRDFLRTGGFAVTRELWMLFSPRKNQLFARASIPTLVEKCPALAAFVREEEEGNPKGLQSLGNYKELAGEYVLCDELAGFEQAAFEQICLAKKSMATATYDYIFDGIDAPQIKAGPIRMQGSEMVTGSFVQFSAISVVGTFLPSLSICVPVDEAELEAANKTVPAAYRAMIEALPVQSVDTSIECCEYDEQGKLIDQDTRTLATVKRRKFQMQ